MKTQNVAGLFDADLVIPEILDVFDVEVNRNAHYRTVGQSSSCFGETAAKIASEGRERQLYRYSPVLHRQRIRSA